MFSLADSIGSIVQAKDESSDTNEAMKAFATTLKLEDILIFMTGSSDIPCSGYSTKPTIQFVHDKRYSSSNTCACILSIAVFEQTYEEFVVSFLTSVMNGKDFSII